MIRRITAAVAAGAALVLALTACTNSLAAQLNGGEQPSTGGTTESRAPVTDGVDLDLLDYYGQTLEWGDCEGVTSDVECADVTAPLDWSDPAAGDISLAIARPSDRPADPQGSLLINPGGPGSSGVDFLDQSIAYGGIGEALFDAYDVVGFDPRGVGRSTPVTCYTSTSDIDAYLYDIPDAERGSDAWDEQSTEADTAYAEACEANSGDLLEHITTDQAARDMDLIRAVLGDEKLNYLGFSYGTYLGATYAELFPDEVGRFVLDGALDPSIPASEVGRTQIIAFEKSLGTYLENCLGSTDCPFRGTTDQALDSVSTLLASLDASPLATSDGRELGADAMSTAILAALYSEENWPYLTQAFAGALQGDPAAAMFLADFYNGRENGGYTSNTTDAFNAYNCMDYPVEEGDTAEADQQLLDEEAPVLGPYMYGTDVCAEWPYPPTGDRHAITADGAAPIVVIGTTGDPATPIQWAESMADNLASGVMVTYDGEGHTAYGSGSACIDDAVETYFTAGTVPADGLECSA
ncbi:alpha/beta hydrolase [Microbacterium indicum]|uniref:alpha/beta hydrolase n=1 Tax=Microbacterium indicum TaxID=358100 RepID=UPI0004158982|nr:alpha/beta hydrolase [Microbacterium indicum]